MRVVNDNDQRGLSYDLSGSESNEDFTIVNENVTTTMVPDAAIFADAFYNALRETFGDSFDLWTRGSSWTCLTSAQPATNTYRLGDRELGVIELLESALKSNNEPVILSQSDGQYLVAIPNQRDNHDAVVGVAICSETVKETLSKLASASITQARLTRELEETQKELQTFSGQSGEILEQLSYLFNLTEYFEHHASYTLAEVAQAVLPHLRNVIHTELLVLVAADDSTRNTDWQVAKVGRPMIRVGTPVLDDEMCCELIERFKKDAIEGPIVQNRIQPGVFPNLENFVLTPVGKDAYSVGWLLAINRSDAFHPDENVNNYPSWGLSEFEFGTGEAALMRFTAGILAMH